jgi:hypothetical protein
MHATFTLTLNYTVKPFNIIFLTFNTVLFKLGKGSNVVVFNGKVTTTLEGLNIIGMMGKMATTFGLFQN